MKIIPTPKAVFRTTGGKESANTTPRIAPGIENTINDKPTLKSISFART